VIDETLLDAEEKMEKAVSHAKEDLSSVRTGRANPSMFARVNVEAYGSMMPLNQVASVNIPEARMAVVKPYDQSQLGAIEKAIRESDLGVNPSNDGQIIRIVIPQLTRSGAARW
jgi:ribosome recycling factor